MSLGDWKGPAFITAMPFQQEKTWKGRPAMNRTRVGPCVIPSTFHGRAVLCEK